MAASAFFFSLMSLLVKVAGRRLPSQEIVLGRAVVCLTLSWLWLRHAGVPPWGTDRRALILRGLLGTTSLLGLYYALTTLPLADTVAILYTSPILTAVFAALLLRESAGLRLVAALVCGLGGVLAITRPAVLFGAATAHLSPWGVLGAAIAAVASSLVYVLVRRIGAREHPLVVVFYFPLVTAPVVLPLALPVWIWPTPLEWLVLAGVGVATQLAQVNMTRGLTLEPAARATSVGYIQVVLAALWGWMFFGEVPGGLTLLGAASIVAATLWLAMSRPATRPAQPPATATASAPAPAPALTQPPAPAAEGAILPDESCPRA